MSQGPVIDCQTQSRQTKRALGQGQEMMLCPKYEGKVTRLDRAQSILLKGHIGQATCAPNLSVRDMMN